MVRRCEGHGWTQIRPHGPMYKTRPVSDKNKRFTFFVVRFSFSLLALIQAGKENVRIEGCLGSRLTSESK